MGPKLITLLARKINASVKTRRDLERLDAEKYASEIAECRTEYLSYYDIAQEMGIEDEVNAERKSLRKEAQ